MNPDIEHDSIPLPLLQRVDRVCLHFEAECRSGRRPQLEPLVAAFPETERGALLTEILLLEWTYRHREGDSFLPEEYDRRFPPLKPVVEQAWQQWKVIAARAETVVPAQQSTVLPRDDRPTVAPPPSPPQAGYEQITLLGRGGMGEVHKAFDPRLKRWVALKRVRLEHDDPDGLRRFGLEAEALARLTHPHIVKVHGFSERDGQPMLEMEYVAGGILEQRLGKTPLEPGEAARLVSILAWAVHAAHEKGIVHRDLKPANVLMDDAVAGNQGNVLGGFPKITDFGLAALTGASSGQTHTGAVLGTPAYMSPEQAAGKTHAIGPPSDVWALGVILYRCLTGALPFTGDSVLDTLERVRTMQMRPLSEVRPDLPPALVEVCMACLARSPGDRPTAAALAASLERLAGKGELTEEFRPVRPRRRRWWLAAAGLVAACLLVVGTWKMLNRGAPAVMPIEAGRDDTPLVKAPPERTSPPPEMSLVVEHWEREPNGKPIRLGIIGKDSFDARYDEGTVVNVRLSRPAHCFVLACNSDGSVQLLWPRNEKNPKKADPKRPPPAVTEMTCPPQPPPEAGLYGANVLRLNDSRTGGMQAFVVVASQKPLPTYAEWKDKLPSAPWQRSLPLKGVFLSKGASVTPLDPKVRVAEEVWTTKVPVQALCDWAKVPGVDVVQALMFPVYPKEGP